MKLIQYPANAGTFTTRAAANAIEGIVLIPVEKDINQILSDVKGCPVVSGVSPSPPCFTGFHFAYDILKDKLYQLVDVADAAYTFNQDGQCEVPEASPIMPGTGANPNDKAVSVAIAVGTTSVVNQECAASTGYTAAEKKKLKCVIEKVLELSQADTAALTTSDVLLYNSDEFTGAGSDRGTINGATLVSILAATCGDLSEEEILSEAAIRQGLLTAEELIATATLTEGDSGKVFYLNAATEFATTLPLPFMGGKFTFIVKAAPSGADYTVVTKNSANIMLGHILTSQDAGGTADSETSGGDTLSFVSAKAVVGDMAEFFSDGVKWYARATSKVFDAITITTAS